MPQRVLLVEGPADQAFYDAACREAGLRHIKVTTPDALGAEVASKTNAIHRLPMLMRQLEDGSIEKLGVVVDADYHAEHGLGFSGTLEKIREKAADFGFSKETRLMSSGFEFSHSDGLPSVGAWIMPNNKSDGMLEDFVASAIVDAEQASLHERAKSAVAGLQTRLFKPIHLSKAQIATWLAWQKVPGCGLASTIGNRLISTSRPSYQAFSAWLCHVFA